MRIPCLIFLRDAYSAAACLSSVTRYSMVQGGNPFNCWATLYECFLVLNWNKLYLFFLHWSSSFWIPRTKQLILQHDAPLLFENHYLLFSKPATSVSLSGDSPSWLALWLSLFVGDRIKHDSCCPSTVNYYFLNSRKITLAFWTTLSYCLLLLALGNDNLLFISLLRPHSKIP